MTRTPLSRDARVVISAQAARAVAYGFGAVLLGTTLARGGLSSVEVGGILSAVVAGTVVASMGVAKWADRWGRRHWYAGLYVALGVTGVVFAETTTVWLLVAAALLGALSTEVVESGPFTSLEQAMLATELTERTRLRGFGAYNAVATAAGSLGALGAGVPGLVRHAWHGAPADQRWFWLFVPVAFVGVVLSWRLSPTVEATLEAPPERSTPVSSKAGGLPASRAMLFRLSGLFALDSFGGGFVVQSFIAFWLTRRFGASVGTIGIVYFAMGVLQTFSFLSATRLAERFGLLPVMVFTHLPSNALLIAVAFSPNLAAAIAMLLVRVTLAQMDVPVRQAYVMALVEPNERTTAAAYTNTARYVARPAGPLLAGTATSAALGAPFAIGGTIKAVYDLILWRWFRHVPVPEEVVK